MPNFQLRHIILILGIVLLFASSALAAAPYPNSTHITGITWDASSYTEDAKGADNFPVTWSDDGKQYVVWGDGNGFHGVYSNNICRASLGVASIDGSLADYRDTDDAGRDALTVDIYGCTQGASICDTATNEWNASCGAANTAQWDGKSYGIISIDGDLYMWWGPGSGASSFGETRLLKSTNYGASWTKSDWNLARPFDNDRTLIMPTILNYGKDNAGAPDEWVYHYFIRCGGDPVGDSSCDNNQPNDPWGLVIQGNPTGYIDLARISKTDMQGNLNDINTKFQWFTGTAGSPSWGAQGDHSVRTPVFTDANGVGWNLSVSYNIGLERYILITEHTESQAGEMGIFDAPNPWGPWTTVEYYTGASDFHDAIGVGGDTGQAAFFWNFSQKWTNGVNFTLFWTGGRTNGSPGDDSFNLIEGTFVAEDPPYSASTFVTDINFDGTRYHNEASACNGGSGSDIWTLTWGIDGSSNDVMFTAYGDGCGFDETVPPSNCLGVSKITGSIAQCRAEDSKPSDCGTDLANMVQRVNCWPCEYVPNPPYTSCIKSVGIIQIDTIIYMMAGGGSDEQTGMPLELYKSTDYGASFSGTGLIVAETPFTVPSGNWQWNHVSFLQFGQNYSNVPAALEDYVYMYSTQATWNPPQTFDGTGKGHYLARVDISGGATAIENENNWEYYNGPVGGVVNVNDTPSWSWDKADATHVFYNSDTNSINGLAARALDVYASYNQALGRVILVNQMYEYVTVPGKSSIGIYESVNPWGPWNRIYYDLDWDNTLGEDGEANFHKKFPTKWHSVDGLTMQMVYSGLDNDPGGIDGFLMQEVTLTVPIPPPLDPAEYYVRPAGGSYGNEDGTDYDNAWDGFSNIDWGVITPGSILFIVGTHREQMNVGASGTSGYPITIISCTDENNCVTE
jgi:hypothetical protein